MVVSFNSVESELVVGRVGVVIPDETVIRLLRLWLDYAMWDGLHLTRPGIGLPQGSPMTA